MRNTLVINAFGGPGAGKSTAAFHIVCALKKKGYIAEYVPEYAKDLVWDGRMDLLDGSLLNQSYILKEQKARVDRLIGKVDFVVTDSPLLLNGIYLKNCPEKKGYIKAVVNLVNQYSNFNFFVERDKTSFETEGRIHNLDESLKKDQEILNMLKDNQMYIGVYQHYTLDYIVRNAINHYKKINKNNSKEDK